MKAVLALNIIMIIYDLFVGSFPLGAFALFLCSALLFGLLVVGPKE